MTKGNERPAAAEGWASVNGGEVIAALPEPAALYDADLRLTCANFAFAELWGLGQREAVGRPLTELFGEALDDALRAALSRVVIAGQPSSERRLELLLSRGRLRLQLYAGPLQGGGAPLGLLVVRDVTEGERTEQLLRARLLLSEQAYTHSMEEVLRQTLDEAERLTGGNIGFFHFLAADQVTLSLQCWSTNTLATMCSADGRGLHYLVDQAGVWVDCVRQRSPVIHNDYQRLPHRRGLPAGHAAVVRELLVPVMRCGCIVAILGTGNKPTDYTQEDVEVVSLLANLAWDLVLHKRSEEALQQSTRDLAKAQEVAHVGSWQLDLRRDRLTWSDELYRIFGLTPGQFGATLTAFLERVHEEDRLQVTEAFSRAVSEGTSYSAVHRVVRPDGEIRVVQERAEQLRDEQGEVIRSVGTTLDITELSRVEEDLRRLNSELEQRVRERTAALERNQQALEELNAQKNLLLGMVAHDLRNPLAVIQGFLSILEDQYLGPLGPRQREVLGRIRGSSQYMLALVNDLLDVSAIEAGRLELHPAPADLLALLQDVLAANQLLAQPKEVSLALASANPLPVVLLDRPRMEQVLHNLLSNAIRHSRPGSLVELRVRRGRGEALLCVADQGPGVAEAELELLFQPFYQGGSPKQGPRRGVGLGLSIARQIVEAHGGRIWAESQPGAGASFYFTLPLEAGPAT